MNINKIGNVKLSIVYIGVILLISSIYYKYFDSDFGLAIILVSLLFLWIFLKEGLEFLIFSLLVFIIGITVNINFYNFNVESHEKIKLEKIYSYGGLGTVNGRELFLKGDLSNCKEGNVIIAEGTFKKELNKSRGKIGNYEIKKFTIDENNINTKLSNLKYEFKDKLNKNIGLRKSTLITSITFGKEKDLDFEDQEYMKQFGVIHALSVSGLHIGIVFLIMKKLFKEKMAIGLTFLYVIMTGMAFSSVRAFIMLFFINLGSLLKRRYNPLCGIGISLIIIFLMAPYCIFNIGFLLSFGATIGIILFNKDINKKLYKLPTLLRETISISLSAQIFTLPLLIIFFNEISIGFIIGNIIIIPIINLILIISVICLFTIRIDVIFDYLSFLLKNIIGILDFVSEIFIELTPEVLNINEYYGYFYISLLITYYIYKKGIKKIIILPISYIIFIALNLYSINPKIEYKNDGSLVISHRGSRILVSNENIDVNKMKSIAVTNDYYKNVKKVIIKENCYLERLDKDYILYIEDNKYYLNMGWNNKINSKYDIINFKEDEITSIIIIGDNLLVI